jgi:hypothetical protein
MIPAFQMIAGKPAPVFPRRIADEEVRRFHRLLPSAIRDRL